MGKKERAALHDNTVVTLTLKDALNDLASNNLIKPKRGFELFQALWPKQDRDPDRLKGAWINAIAKPKEDVRAVLLVALLWNRFAKRFPDDFAPFPGKWLARRGWLTARPFRTDHNSFSTLEDALAAPTAKRLEAIDAVAEELLESPFEVLREIGRWPDDDLQIARNAFNAVLSKGVFTAGEIIRKAERKLSQCGEAGNAPPMLGWWLKRRFGSFRNDEDETDDEEATAVGACTIRE